MKKDKNLSIRISPAHEGMLEKFGGKTKGFELIMEYAIANIIKVEKFELQKIFDEIKNRGKK